MDTVLFLGKKDFFQPYFSILVALLVARRIINQKLKKNRLPCDNDLIFKAEEAEVVLCNEFGEVIVERLSTIPEVPNPSRENCSLQKIVMISLLQQYCRATV